MEKSIDYSLGADEYQCSPLLIDWLEKQGTPPPNREILHIAADYQYYLYKYQRRTLQQAMTCYHALLRAEERDIAHRLALDTIIGRLNLTGLYHRILTDWLPEICKSNDLQIKGEALGQTGKQYLHLGDYETALKFLQQSLAIRQEIGDVAGLCATLFNIGHIHAQNKAIDDAMSAWIEVYRLARQINLAQVLEALADLAPQLGLPEGLEGWETLAKARENE